MDVQQAYGSLNSTERGAVTDLVRSILDLHQQVEGQTHASDHMWHRARVSISEAEQLGRLRRNVTRTDRIATLHADARYYAARARGHIAEADDIHEEVARMSDLLRELVLAASACSAPQAATEATIASLEAVTFSTTEPPTSSQPKPPNSSSSSGYVAPVGAGSAPCVICFVELSAESVVRLPCEHMFHRDCVISWLRRSNTCPLCRRKLEGNH